MDEIRALILDRIRTNGPISFAEYMDLALYHPTLGYYARASRRTGRAGDFFTSVDVGPLFGELLARQLGEMWRILQDRLGSGLQASGFGPGTPSTQSWAPGAEPESRIPNPESRAPSPESRILSPDPRTPSFDLVEAGAGSGRLACDVLDAAIRHDPRFYAGIDLHLVDRSAAARAAQHDTLGAHVDRLRTSGEELPRSVRGAILANELLDALPTHAVLMTGAGLREVFVDALGDQLVERHLEPSTHEIAKYLSRVGAALRPGWRTEVNLAAMEWVRNAAQSLERGFLLLLDYGHDAHELYSASHAAGTLTTFRRHSTGVPGSPHHSPVAACLVDPGECDMTAHVDLTSVTRVAEAEGLLTLGRLDQTYFLLGLGLADLLEDDRSVALPSLERRLALKTLMLPGGLGSTHKVLIFGKRVGTPQLRGCSYRMRLT